MKRAFQPVVHHKTSIILKPHLDKSLLFAIHATPMMAEQFRACGGSQMGKAQRIAAMIDLLAAIGFDFRIENQSVFAESTEVEAQAAENYLVANGFDYSEFQVILEYTRIWGMM